MVGPRVQTGSLADHVKNITSSWIGGSSKNSVLGLSSLHDGVDSDNYSESDSETSSEGSHSDSDADSTSSFMDKLKGANVKTTETNGLANAVQEIEKSATTNGIGKEPATSSSDDDSESDSESASESKSDTTSNHESGEDVKAALQNQLTASQTADSQAALVDSLDNEDEDEEMADLKDDEEEADQSFAMSTREIPDKRSGIMATSTQTTTLSAAGRNQFATQGFQMRHADENTDASDVARIFHQARLEGKQLWYFTAPASVPLTLVEQMAIPLEHASQEKAIIHHAGEDYGVSFDDTMTTRVIKLVIPNKAGDKYSLLDRSIDQTMHLKRVTHFASDAAPSVQPPPPAAVSATATASSAKTKGPRPQPEGLKNRFLPIGVNNHPAAKMPITPILPPALVASKPTASETTKKRKHAEQDEGDDSSSNHESNTVSGAANAEASLATESMEPSAKKARKFKPQKADKAEKNSLQKDKKRKSASVIVPPIPALNGSNTSSDGSSSVIKPKAVTPILPPRTGSASTTAKKMTAILPPVIAGGAVPQLPTIRANGVQPGKVDGASTMGLTNTTSKTLVEAIEKSDNAKSIKAQIDTAEHLSEIQDNPEKSNKKERRDRENRDNPNQSPEKDKKKDKKEKKEKEREKEKKEKIKDKKDKKAKERKENKEAEHATPGSVQLRKETPIPLPTMLPSR